MERRKGSQESRRGTQQWGGLRELEFCVVRGSWEGGWRGEWRRSEEEVEKQSPGGSEFNQESEPGGTGLTQAEPSGPSVGEGTLGGKWSRAHSREPMSLSGLKACPGVGLFGGHCTASGLLGRATEPALCRGVWGLWQASPPGTPLTRRDCRKAQGLLSSGCFEPPLVALAGSPPGAQHTHRGLPARQAPTLQINS